jgi:hypothetical protein
MTFAGFFVHIGSIPPVLRWLQWLCPLRFALEALSINEVSAGLEISDNLQGVPVHISASLVMSLVSSFTMSCHLDWITKRVLALWVQIKRVLSRRSRAFRVHCRFRCQFDRRGVDLGEGNPMTNWLIAIQCSHTLYTCIFFFFGITPLWDCVWIISISTPLTCL